MTARVVSSERERNRFRELADRLPHIVWTLDASGAFDYGNRLWHEKTGLSPALAMSWKGLALIVPSDDLERQLPVLRDCIAQGIAHEGEHRLKHVDASPAEYRWQLLRLVPAHDDSGRITGWIGTDTDIHDRKVAELALAKREAFIHRVLDSTDDWISLLDLEGRLLSMSSNGQRRLEIEDLAGFIGRDWTEFWRDGDRDSASAAVAGARDGRAGRFEGCVPTSSGTPIWWDVVVSPIVDANGAPDKFLASARDVTKLRTVAAALAQSQRAHTLLANSLPAIVFSTDACGAIDYVNERWTEYTGLGLEASLGSSWAEKLVHPDDLAALLIAWKSAISGACLFEHEYRLRRANDGVYRWHLTRATPMLDEAGNIARWFGTTTDIEEQKDAFERERRWSSSFQRASLPPSLPEVAGLHFDAVYEPGLSEAQVGGDWYDAVRLSDGRVLVSIGDVAGHGINAAVVMGVVRQIMRGIAQVHADPPLMLDAADRALRSEHPEVFVTAWVGIFDLVTRALTYASAGHPPPLLVTAGGVRELSDASLPLGLRDGRDSTANVVAVPDRASLVLYTDGLTEATHDLSFGERRLDDAARRLACDRADPTPAKTLAREIIPEGSGDDVAILVARTHYDRIEPFFDRWTFDATDAVAAAGMRTAFAAALAARGFPADALPNAELAFGELLGNVVRHAPGVVEVIVDSSGPRPVLHMLDRGPGFRHISRLPADPFSESGRGLFIVSAISDEFNVSLRPEGGSHARVLLRL